MNVKINRKGDIIVKEVTLKNLEGTEEMHKDTDSFYNEVLGIRAQSLPSSLRSELGINYGLKIVEVKDGIFKQKGITNDFIILSVNYQKVSSENDLRKALSNDRNGKIRIEGILNLSFLHKIVSKQECYKIDIHLGNHTQSLTHLP